MALFIKCDSLALWTEDVCVCGGGLVLGYNIGQKGPTLSRFFCRIQFKSPVISNPSPKQKLYII